jgi:alkanesulfonate monooxygenase SsuD/methylene tetrahydromethanopterin reductase-like flavin-dependent oxidoreductase (luciferase family)/predicted kinase
MTAPIVSLDAPALVVLIGAAGSGKSTWAEQHFRRTEIVSSDQLRAIVGSGAHDLDATADAFAALDLIVGARLERGLTTVVDTLGTDVARRRDWLASARSSGVRAVAVHFDTPPDECRRRNRRRDVPVPAPALAAQLRRVAAAVDELAAETWDEVIRVRADIPPQAEPVPAAEDEPDRALRFVLQISRFPWDDADPAGWLRAVAVTAADAGFDGIALMDHLIQIPQVGRAWEPIPEPWVTLGLLAALPTRLRLGTLVSPMSMHSAGRLAKSAATLDALTGGRAFCGVGAGWWEREHLAFGLPFKPAGHRLDELEAALPVMRALWAPGTKAAAGLPETTNYPRPVGELPIIVGGRGPRLLDIARRLGDACNVPSRPELVVSATEAMAGKRVTVLDVPVLGRDREHAAQLVERLRGRTSAVAYARQHSAGTPTEHIARYRRLADLGVDTVFVALPDLAGTDEVERFAAVTAAFS